MSTNNPRTSDDLPKPDNPIGYGGLPLPPERKPTLNEWSVPAPGAAQPYQPNAYLPGAPPLPPRSLPPGVHGPVAPNLKIEEGVLRGAALKADGVFDKLSKQAAALEEPTKKAARGVEGLQIASALTASNKNWERQAGTVTAWLAYISESLIAAANSYHQRNQSTKDVFNRLKQPYSPLLPQYQNPPLAQQPQSPFLDERWSR
ncbi:hypothetical protein LRS74_19530 [Streptomyces sp. LX-29]|uniref:hypothetical protein n=1 Tax=Streptomyces sp. LX-29 TaxID=2900152 RepID=UPI00240D7B5D|nr:hypothetical protein [Streptomyces sp. LX-29]WFB08989.1 hypothetical protein LRS74_19530 [Streptomyces sp. LX-29]